MLFLVLRINFFCTQLFFDIDAPLLDVVASSAFHSKILDDVYLND